MLTKVNNSSSDGFYWAQVGITRFGESNYFSLDAIFLFFKSQRSEGGRKEFCIGGSEKVETVVTYEKLNRFEVKRLCVRFCGCVFTRAKKIEESNGDHVTDAYD